MDQISRLGRFFAILITLSWVLTVAAQDTESPKKSISELEAQAEKGDARAQFELAREYMTGGQKGSRVPRNYGRALQLFINAGDQGHVLSQYMVGVMFHEGMGVPQTLDVAARSFRRAAEKGFVEAQFALARMYALGQGVKQDHTEAARWFRRAAEQGHSQSQGTIGVMYYEGVGVSQDYAEAYSWLTIAIGAEKSQDQLVKYLNARAEVARKINPEQVAEVERRAREWKPVIELESPDVILK